MRPATTILLSILLAGLSTPPSVADETATDEATPSARAMADYERMRERRYGAPIPVPEGGIEITRDTTTFTLLAGTLRLAEPLEDGAVTGLVFTGEGRLVFEVPDPVERAQLARVTGGQAGGDAGLEERFTRLVLRGVDAVPPRLASSAGGYDHERLAEKRHEHWLEQRFVDVDARVVAGRAIAGDRFLWVDFESERFGWLAWVWDDLSQEEVVLARWDPAYRATEEWIRLDRPEERDARGRPTSRRRSLVDLIHVELEVDLVRGSRKLPGTRGAGGMEARRGRLRATLELRPRRAGLRALPLVLDSWSEVSAVRDGEGRPLAFLRDPVGTRSSSLDRDLYDDDLLVLFDRPLDTGRPTRIEVVWERDFHGFLPGRAWYPGERDAWDDPHAARLAVVALGKHDVRATGELREDRDEGRLRYRTWVVERPTRALSLTYAEKIRECRREGAPGVVVVSHRGPGQIESVADDVAASAAFFGELFAHPLAAETLTVTAIDAGHGQAFEGFLHLGRSTFDNAFDGRAERFRAHEVAHQWWGHAVGWASYRDQWLAEAMAETSALVFLEARHEKGREYYDEVIAHYAGMALGTAPPSPRFSRLWALERNDARRARIGPIGLGYRAATAASPAGYFAQTYVKGTLVLHMLRRLLDDRYGEGTFVAVLRRLLAEHAGDAVATRDLETALERVTGASWGWFFAQWVQDTAIPTYRWSWRTEPDPATPGHARLVVEVEQSGVPAGFRMPVPVDVVFADGTEERYRIDVDRPRVVWTKVVATVPERVRFAPGHAVLARVERTGRVSRVAP